MIYGEAARIAYAKAAALVREGRFDEARQVEMRGSDRVVIEAKIVAAVAKQAMLRY